MIQFSNLTEAQQRFFAALPQNQFILWKFEPNPNGEKPGKVPCDRFGKRVNAHDPQNWLTFHLLCRTLAMPSNLRPGFVLTEDDQLFLLDLDNARDPETGELSPDAQEAINLFRGAGFEVSISGTGIHIIARCDARKLGDRRNKWADGKYEWYVHKRFVALGTNQSGDPAMDCTRQLDALVPRRGTTGASSPLKKQMQPANPHETCPSSVWDGPTEDDELVEKMLFSRGSLKSAFGYKARFSELWNADLDALGKHFPADDGKRPCDWSSADLALFSRLAFWTGKDVTRMIRLYKTSALAAVRGEKSERPDYLLRTARAAAASCTDVYSAGKTSNALVGGAAVDGDLSDHELALHLFNHYWAESARFIVEQGKWMFWEGKRWVVDHSKQRHLQLVRAQLSELAETWNDPRIARKLKSKRKIDEITALMKSNPGATVMAEDLDRDPMLLGVPSGVVDLRTGELREAKRSEYITKSTAVDPAPKGARPEPWIRFLHRIMDGDVDMVRYLQRIAGYALTGSTEEHAMFFALGSGRNGKSTFLNTLIHVQGPYAGQAQSDLFLQKLGSDHPTGLAALNGKRLVRSSELPVGRTWNDTLLKQITGGDPVTAHFMRQDDFTYVPQFTLVIDANNAPSFHGIDEAIRRRFKVIPFSVTIPESEVDNSLPEKLKEVASEILRWCIDGAVDWLTNGLCEPAKVVNATAEYFEIEDLLGEFISDTYTKDASSCVPAGEFRNAFCEHLELNGQIHWKANTLGKEMKKRGFAPKKLGGQRYYSGLRRRIDWPSMPTGTAPLPQ